MIHSVGIADTVAEVAVVDDTTRGHEPRTVAEAARERRS